MVKRLSTVDQNNQTLINIPTPSAASHAATKAYVDDAVAGVGGAGSTTNYFNTMRSAQKNLTGSGITALTGDVNGTNPTFTTPEGIYIAGTLQVYLNGVLQVLGDAITETTPASGIFTFATPPLTGDQILAYYQSQAVSNESLGNVDGPASTTDNTIARYDGTTGKIIQSSAATISDAGELTTTSLNVDGTNGSLLMNAVTDGGDFNLYHAEGTAKTLAIYGAGGGTMNISLLDGTFDIGGALVPTVSSTSKFTNKTLVAPTLYTNATDTAVNKLTVDNTGVKFIDFNGDVTLNVNNDDKIVETPYGIKRRVTSITSSATPAINPQTTDQFNITALAANITSMTSGLTGATPHDGQRLMIRIKDNGTARTITWGASFVSSGVATLLATTVINKTHMVGLIYDAAAAKWVCVAVDAAGY